MNPHDILDEPERLGRPFIGSLALHGGAIAVFLGLTAIHPFGKVERWGDPNGGRFGAVAVNAVKTIPIPSRSSTPNPVAADTESQVPQRPAKVKEQPKQKAPDANAIPLKSKSAKQKLIPHELATPRTWAESQPPRPNQVYSNVPQAAGSPLYQVQGGGGVGVGTNSPFGTRFGYYANILRDKVGAAWHVDAGVKPQAQVTIQFTILRDGRLAPGLPRIVQTSGDNNLDRSAQRAIMDAAPFPQLPNGFDRSEATVELTFVARR